MCGYCGCSNNRSQDHHHHEAVHTHTHDLNVIDVEQAILSENQHYADKNRTYFQDKNITALNLVSSPGSGKTTLLVETIRLLKKHFSISVIEGDQQTDIDRQRIAALGIPVLQLNTGKACHLDAHRVHHGLETLSPKANSLLFIENVGNLVCPAMFDLGEHSKVVVLSTTEGDDKPLKYPYMFAESKLMVINKIDLLPYVSFDVDCCIQFARQINPSIEIITVSALSIHPSSDWIKWLMRNCHYETSVTEN